MDIEPTTNMANNDTDNEFDTGISGMLSVSGAAIKDTGTGLIVGESNNDTNNEVDKSMSGVLSMAIKDTDRKSTISRDNNNMDVKVDASVFMGRTITKTLVELNMSRLGNANTIIEKEVYESNLI